jgi:hypothetical protein
VLLLARWERGAWERRERVVDDSDSDADSVVSDPVS